MSETCIVCLGDLEGANTLPHPLIQTMKSEDDSHTSQVSNIPKSARSSHHPMAEMIAHLLPCGHNLHDECLKPWVERANSCPICRQSFNQVELSNTIRGPVLSSYAVPDRTQVADIDPSMIVEEYYEEEPEDQPCPICGDNDNEERLLQCDNCDAYYHTYCVSLDDIPVGHWFCDTCQTIRAVESVCPTGNFIPRPHHTSDRRTRGQQRRVRNRNQASASSWARVWQSVWDNLNLDLDFPFDEGYEERSQTPSQRADIEQWQRRFNVAESQGRTNGFRDAASTLLNIRASRDRPSSTDPETREEIRAWNAFEKAKEIEMDPTPKRKRKSATTSPSDADPVPQPQRPLKRPRTRRTINQADTSSTAGPSRSRRGSATGPSSAHNQTTHAAFANNNGPSFLQSMLKEIETSSAPDETKGQSRFSTQYATGRSSPGTSSPGVSPTSSNYASPRARSATPPPSISPRPGSPFALTSKVEPIFPPPEFSPVRSPPEKSLSYRPHKESRKGRDHRQPQNIQQGSPQPGPRSQDSSPTRATMSLSTKSDIQKMVSTALKPHYYSNAVSKDEFTDINRNVSRMLYDRVGDTGTINGERESWERLATNEVTKAIQLLKSTT